MGFINSVWIQFFVGIGFLVTGIYLIRKFVKDRKNENLSSNPNKKTNDYGN